MAKDLAAQYEPIIQGAAKAFDLDPNILRGMAQTESGFDPDVISGKRQSKAGAIGIMQFMPETAKRFGVDPTNPKQAIFASAQYLRENLDKFGGDYQKAVAGYNWGENRDAYNQPDWVKRLPAETKGYVKQVLTHAAQRTGPEEEKPVEATAPKTEAERLRASVAKIPGTETDILPTPRKEMGMVERVKDIGKGLVEIPGAMIGGAFQKPVAAIESLVTGRDVKQSGYEMKPVESQFAQDVLGGLGRVAEAAKIPEVTPGMLVPQGTNLMRPAMQQAARPVVNELAMVKGAAQDVMAQRAANKLAERSAESYRRAPQIEAAQEANRLGIAQAPNESNPTLGNLITEKVVGAGNIERQVAEANRFKPTEIGLRELGLDATDRLNAEGFNKARERTSAPYKEVGKLENITTDENTTSALRANSPDEFVVGNATKGRVDRLIDEIETGLGKGVSGEQLVKKVSQLRKDARTLYKKTDLGPEDRAVADASMGLADTLEGLIETNIQGSPKLLADFRKARELMAKSYVWENITNDATSIPDMAKLAKVVEGPNALTGDTLALAKIAANRPESFTAKTRSALARAGDTYLARSGVPGSIGLLLGGLPGGVAGAALGLAAKGIGAKRIVKPSYQAKRAIPKDYRNNLAPVEKLNKLAK